MNKSKIFLPILTAVTISTSFSSAPIIYANTNSLETTVRGPIFGPDGEWLGPGSGVDSNNNNNNNIENVFNQVNYSVFEGFSFFSDGFQSNVGEFNKATGMFRFRAGFNPINPGVHQFTHNQLIGVRANGTEVILDRGSIEGGSIVYDLVYNTVIRNYNDFAEFRIELTYNDTLWGITRHARAVFTID